MTRIGQLTLAATALLPIGSASAVVVYVPGSPNPTATRNTAPPTGALANSGWQLQGDWAGSFLGTPIAPNHFVTASHVGGSVGTTFTFNAVNYTTTAVFQDPNSDLAVWRVSGTFPTHAPLYNAAIDGPETGKPLVVFGRGLAPGAEVIGPAFPTGTELKGWREADGTNGPRSWGENDVTGIATGSATVGELIAFTFDRSVGDVPGTNESHLNGFDSGGGLFIESGGVWKLAGINFGIDGPYKVNPSDIPFRATLFDQGGLYEKSSGDTFMQNLDTSIDQPGASYSTRISSNLPFIESVVPEPSTALLLAGGGAGLMMRRRRGVV